MLVICVLCAFGISISVTFSGPPYSLFYCQYLASILIWQKIIYQLFLGFILSINLFKLCAEMIICLESSQSLATEHWIGGIWKCATVPNWTAKLLIASISRVTCNSGNTFWRKSMWGNYEWCFTWSGILLITVPVLFTHCACGRWLTAHDQLWYKWCYGIQSAQVPAPERTSLNFSPCIMKTVCGIQLLF